MQDLHSLGLSQLYVTDDDIVQTSQTISRAFALMHEYGLLLAQPSLCSPFESATWQNPLYKDARLVLQYTTFVEIMVPIFNMHFFVSKVIDTLEHAETGGMLDLVLLSYMPSVLTDMHLIHLIQILCHAAVFTQFHTTRSSH